MEQVICEICSESVKKCFIKQHMKRKHTDKNDKKFKCDECPFATHTQNLLKMHICNVKKRYKMKKTGDKDKCEHCGREFKTKKSYIAHKHHYDIGGKCEEYTAKLHNLNTECGRYDPGVN